jgi:hypothetical protein
MSGASILPPTRQPIKTDSMFVQVRHRDGRDSPESEHSGTAQKGRIEPTVTVSGCSQIVWGMKRHSPIDEAI